jgi:hypothetical protein
VHARESLPIAQRTADGRQLLEWEEKMAAEAGAALAAVATSLRIGP